MQAVDFTAGQNFGEWHRSHRGRTSPLYPCRRRTWSRT